MRFTLGEVLTVTTGKLMCDITCLYKILNYMTGDNLYTHQLGRGATVCGPALLEQFPQLKAVNAGDVTPENVRQRLADMEKIYGNEFDVTPIGAWEKADPVEELISMVGAFYITKKISGVDKGFTVGAQEESNSGYCGKTGSTLREAYRKLAAHFGWEDGK